MAVSKQFLLLMLVLSLLPVPTHAGDYEANALVRDIETIVAAAEQGVWNIDRYEIQELMDDALTSVCRAEDNVRVEAQAILQRRITQAGGPAFELWKEQGDDAQGLDELLTLERSLKTLKAAVGQADNDCPFLMQKTSPYPEQQRATGRFFLASEGGGLLNYRPSGAGTRAGGGGSGRIMLGYGLSPNWSLRIGPEFGGAGLLDESLDAADVQLEFYSALPFTLRHRQTLWHQDLEAAVVALGPIWRQRPRLAARLAALVGLTYIRIGKLQPWGGLRIASEYAPETATRVAHWTFRVGFRFGFNFHL